MTDALSPERIARYAYQAGFRGDALTRAVAVALAESSGRPRAHNARPPDDSYGLWQINMLGALGPARREQLHLASDTALFDPAANARAAYAISSHGKNWQPWSTFTNGSYRQHLAVASRAAQAAAQHHGGAPSPDRPGPTSRRVVLDLAELTKLGQVLRHCADRVEHVRRSIRNLAVDTEAARSRLADPALATLIATLLETADAPSQLRLARQRLDRQGAYAEQVRRLAERADGPDGRWSAADARRFLHSIGSEVDPRERAVREAVLGGLITRGHTVLGMFGSAGRPAHHHPHAPSLLPPPDVDGLVNGRVPPSRLSSVGDGERLIPAAARQFRLMDAAAKAAGLNLHVTSGYRTYAEQASLYHDYLYADGPLAAKPGHSTHGVGLSADVDVRDARVSTWLRHNAARFGFVPDVPSEPWHWTYRPR